MHGNGWQDGRSWGREVKLSPEVRRRIASDVERRGGGCQATRDMTAILPVARWRQLGVRTLAGRKLPSDLPDAGLVTGQSRAFLVYRNYDALIEYNCAHSYAIGVALMADRIAAAPAPVGSTP
jgi:membrane-bound lytic murein transglycosylase B